MSKERGIKTNGESIRKHRKALGLTQEQLAARCDCSTRTIRSAENGSRVDMTTLSRLANAFAVSIHSLSLDVTDDQDMERNRRIAMEWEDAFFHSDLERLLALHHPDAETVLPGSEGMPAGGNFLGLDQLRDHFRGVFETFEYLENHSNEFTAVGEKVFQRSHSTWRVKANNQQFTSTFINEFSFKDGKIIHRLTVSDLTDVHEALDE